MSVIAFHAAAGLVDSFIDLLAKHGITPAIGSRAEAEFLSVMQLMDLGRTTSFLKLSPFLLAEAGGIYDLAAKLLAIQDQPEFKTFVPHLQLFASPNAYTSITQTTGGHISDDAGRKLVELYFGALAVHAGSDVELDDPVSSSGNNPDVLFTLTDEANQTTRWALAIKAISTKAGQTIFENIKKAAQQIDAKACDADRGLVLISVGSAIDHQHLWDTVFSTESDALSALRGQVRSLASQVDLNRPSSDWEGLFARRVSPLILFSAHAVVRIASEGPDVPTILKLLYIHDPLSRSDESVYFVVGILNEFMQTVLQGIPGTAGQLPR